MIRRNAEKLTELCCERKWITEEYREWCVYALEKWMGMLLFFSAVALWMIVSRRSVETAAFLAPFYLLRRRMGGCHAKSPLTCFLVSVGLVVFVSLLLGEWLMGMPRWALFSLDAGVMLLALVLSPAYPPQVNFTETEKRANGRRKNILLVLLLAVQLAALALGELTILSHSLCGVALAVITVVIQKKKLKGEKKNEEA